ncbi:MAG: hypothetical protein FKY71_19690 [Spiribacter salinus]|uniref:Uncharacterized protein n=1 Tax=Spiribacter salinus TaxID=1335746 RepID=A0A540V7A5_9GAMM|nr:MAG: hypothetical protein FKY71_19690 [Spiribacter salinus]
MKRKHAQRLVAEAAEYGVSEAECREFAPWAFTGWPKQADSQPRKPLPLPEDRLRDYTRQSAPVGRSAPNWDARAALAEYGML